MSVLLDVNVLLAWAWQTHDSHAEISIWLDSLTEFHTCALVELGFLRVSLSPGYRASFADAKRALQDLKARDAASSIRSEFQPSDLPQVSASKDVTDAYLVILAKLEGLRFATLDQVLCTKPWALGTAFHPLHPKA